jgi:hypothetical protein
LGHTGNSGMEQTPMGKAGCFGLFWLWEIPPSRRPCGVIPDFSALFLSFWVASCRFCLCFVSLPSSFYTRESGVVFICAVLALPTSTPGWTCVFVSHSMAFYYHL